MAKGLGEYKRDPLKTSSYHSRRTGQDSRLINVQVSVRRLGDGRFIASGCIGKLRKYGRASYAYNNPPGRAKADAIKRGGQRGCAAAIKSTPTQAFKSVLRALASKKR